MKALAKWIVGLPRQQRVEFVARFRAKHGDELVAKLREIAVGRPV